MKKIAASDLTFLGIHKEDSTEQHMYTIPDHLGETLASPGKPPCDGFYVLIFVWRQEELVSVRLHVENQIQSVETTLVEGVDYDRKNMEQCEREAYAPLLSNLPG